MILHFIIRTIDQQTKNIQHFSNLRFQLENNFLDKFQAEINWTKKLVQWKHRNPFMKPKGNRSIQSDKRKKQTNGVKLNWKYTQNGWYVHNNESFPFVRRGQIMWSRKNKFKSFCRCDIVLCRSSHTIGIRCHSNIRAKMVILMNMQPDGSCEMLNFMKLVLAHRHMLIGRAVNKEYAN